MSSSGSPPASPQPARRALFDQLMHESRSNAPGARYSHRVRSEIERMSPSARVALVSRTRHGAAPLFLACARGNLEAAAYLIEMCGAPLEQRGVYRAPAPAEGVMHRVTPLWAAAVAGRLDVVRALAAAGADLHAVSDSGSTALRSACFMSHVHVVEYLLAHGADPHRPNHNGGTALVNSVQSERLCAMLLDAGAAVDAPDAQRKTALHYAIQEHRADAARLLLDRGADPLRETRDGDDALRIACIKGAGDIVHMLVARVPYGAARTADAYELFGASRLDEYNDAAGALAAWRRATALRHAAPAYVPKRPVLTALAALGGGVREWTALDELEAGAGDADWLRMQALLVATRVLGPAHKDTLFRVMYRGAAYADASRYCRCVRLWTHVLHQRIHKDTLLHPETSQTLVALTRMLMCSEARAGGAGRGRGRALSAPHAAVNLLRYINRAIPECQALLSVRPMCRVQSTMFSRALRCATHLAHVALTADEDAPVAERASIDDALRQEVCTLVRLGPLAHATGDSLLHLACSRLNVVRSTYFADEVSGAAPPLPALFPSVRVVRLLLACGADVTRRNRARCTPLHLAAIPYNFSTELVEALLDAGAHLDQPNRFGDSALELVLRNPQSRVRPLLHVTLACRAARALLRLEGDAAALLPATLRPFLDLHRP